LRAVAGADAHFALGIEFFDARRERLAGTLRCLGGKRCGREDAEDE
jgi:hypothetical protein